MPSPDHQQRVADAFSRKAAEYDAFGRDHPNLARMRHKVYAELARWHPPGSRLLELNAGTGLDAMALVRRGYRVHATELAPGMVAEIRRKIAVYGLQDRLTVAQCSFTQLDGVTGGPFDAVLSNLGGLNCTPDITGVARQLPRLLRPGSTVTWVVMPRCCPWEMGLAWKDPAVALRRWRRGGTWANVAGVSFRTTYYSLGQVRRAFGPAFRLAGAMALSLLTPPADNDRFARRHPRVYRWLAWLDDGLCRLPVFRGWGDFFVVTMRYQPAP